ncbi:proton-conducting transporter transmembrane domain-containing protein [Haliovirga abyssi]|uniref:Hydrogenase n=1 Tax=Haliovirga abyssi TaxID=2996794 RepID=A0AAU9D654_9FUSO|nr:proton-conducting transporter membrane subunit [Haliovirga abyssi]BDU51454.1 hydrogenase [Haliovirga abyssi]
MGTIWVVIFFILLGGSLPLVLYKNFTFMRVTAVFFIGLGSILGVITAIKELLTGNYPDIVKYSGLMHFPMEFKVTPLSAFFITIICFVGMLGALYGYSYMENRKKALRVAGNYFFYSILVVSMILVVIANNLLTFAFAWEVMSLSAFFLVIYDYNKEKVRKAGYVYFVFTHIGGMAIFASFGLIYAYTKSFGFDTIGNIPDNIKLIAFILAFIGFGSKAGLFPVHVWLPYAHPVAPSQVSAIMSGVMIKIGIYGIIKMYLILHTNMISISYMVVIIGAISGVLGVVYALGQHNLKKLLAYHSIENIGIITTGLGIGMVGVSIGNSTMAIFGFAGGILHILNHALFKSLLFMGAGSVLHQTKLEVIEQMGGLMKNMKITGITFLVGALAISGVPPFNGFVSEFLIYFAGFSGINSGSGVSFAFATFVILSLAIIGGLAAACFTKVIGVVFLGNARNEKAAKAVESKWEMTLPMEILALVCISIGILPALPINVVSNIVKTFWFVSKDAVMPTLTIPSEITFGAMIFLGVLIVVYILWKIFYINSKNKKSVTWGCGYKYGTSKMQYTGSSYAMEIVNFFKPFIKIEEKTIEVEGLFPKKSKYHSKTIDIAEYFIMKYIVRPVLAVMDKLRWIQSGDLHAYILYIVGGIVLLLIVEVVIK